MKFEPYETDPAQQATGPPEQHANFSVLRINQATQLNTTDWKKFDLTNVNFFLVRDMAVDFEIKVNDKSSDPIDLNPGDFYPGRVNKIWVRNKETYPGSLDKENIVLWLNPVAVNQQTNTPLLKQVYEPRSNYGKGDNVNALIVELDTGRYGGRSFVEFWAYIESGYDGASTPQITIYGATTPLEDGETETGADGMRFLSRWDYEDELAKSSSAVLNSKNYFHATMNNAYRYMYLAVDFGEDGGTDLYGNCEIEIVSTR